MQSKKKQQQIKAFLSKKIIKINKYQKDIANRNQTIPHFWPPDNVIWRLHPGELKTKKKGPQPYIS